MANQQPRTSPLRVRYNTGTEELIRPPARTVYHTVDFDTGVSPNTNPGVYDVTEQDEINWAADLGNEPDTEYGIEDVLADMEDDEPATGTDD